MERARGPLPAEIEQDLRGGEEENGASGEDRAMRDVLRDHRLSKSAGRGENDVARALDEVEPEERLDERAIDGGGPIPIEVGHQLELLEPRSRQAPIESTPRAILLLDVRDVLEDLGRSPVFLGGDRDEIVERAAGGNETEGTKTLAQITHRDPPCRRSARARRRRRASAARRRDRARADRRGAQAAAACGRHARGGADRAPAR